jgi:hypothetical protein
MRYELDVMIDVRKRRWQRVEHSLHDKQATLSVVFTYKVVSRGTLNVRLVGVVAGENREAVQVFAGWLAQTFPPQ